MSEEKKVTEEELNQIKKLQDSYLQVAYDFGQLAIEKIELQARIKKVEEVYETNAQHLQVLRTQEQELSTSLQEKYGSSTIDLETGVIK